MGPLFSILFSLVCIAVCVTAVIGAAFFIKDRKARSIFVGGMVAVGAGIILLVVIQFYLNSSPTFVFQHTFDFDPPADVSSLQGEISDAFDVKVTWLHFKAQRATLEKLVAKRRMFEVSRESALASNFTSTEGAPSYWQPFASESAKFYTSSDESEKLIYNEKEGEVYFRSWKLQ